MAQENMPNYVIQGNYAHSSDDYTKGCISELDTSLERFEYITSASEANIGKSMEDTIVYGSSSICAPSSSDYFSTRIQKLLQQRTEIGTDFEAVIGAEIEASKDHWTELNLVKSENEAAQTNLEIFQSLKKKWTLGFFGDWKGEWVLGRKIAEGGQAEIYEAELIWDDGTKKNNGCVLKVFKEGIALQDLQRQWPQGMLRKEDSARHDCHYGYYYTGRSCTIIGGILLKNGRFAFLMKKYWGDLRKLIDLRMQCNRNSCLPFTDDVATTIMFDIARGMCRLCDDNIIHRDLKASNVFISAIHYPNFPNFDPVVREHKFECKVGDFECSVGVIGTGFWRAPEILLGLKNGHVEPTQESDVYSYAMTCYEILTGCIPFEGYPKSDYNVVICGERPTLPTHTKPWIRELLSKCWCSDPFERPTFKDIQNICQKQR